MSAVTHLPSKQAPPVRIRYAPPAADATPPCVFSLIYFLTLADSRQRPPAGVEPYPAVIRHDWVDLRFPSLSPRGPVQFRYVPPDLTVTTSKCCQSGKGSSLSSGALNMGRRDEQVFGPLFAGSSPAWPATVPKTGVIFQTIKRKEGLHESG